MYSEAKSYIMEHVDYRGQLELLAEEAAELSQAALKTIRTLDGVENVYPVNPDKYDQDVCYDNLIEEITDVFACCEILGLSPNRALSETKTQGMVERLKKASECQEKE